MAISKKKRLNKKHSKKTIKNIQYGGWQDIFENPDLTYQQVKDLILTVQDGKLIIRSARYEGICGRLIEYRLILNNDELRVQWPVYRRYIFNFLKNINKIIDHYRTIQLSKNKDTFYFHFEDGILYKDTIKYSDAENRYADIPVNDDEDEDFVIAFSRASTQQEVERKATLRALYIEQNRVRRHDFINLMINNMVIMSIFMTNVLLENFAKDIRDHNNTIRALTQRLQEQQEEVPAQQNTQNDINNFTTHLNDIKQQYITRIRDIKLHFLDMFTNSLIKILDSESPHDISYIKCLHEDVIQLYRLLIQLPKCPEVDEILNLVALRLFLKVHIVGRFSFLKILSNDSWRDLSESDKYTYQFRCSDLIKLSNPNENIPGENKEIKELYFYNIVTNTINKMKISNIIRPLSDGRVWWDTMNFEFIETMERLGDTSIQFSIQEPHIHNVLKQINNLIDLNLEEDFKEHIIHLLFFLKVIIYHNQYVLNTFLVLIIIHIITTLVDSRYTDSSFKHLLASIIELCYESKSFRNYLPMMIDEDPYNKYSFVWVINNGELIRQQLSIDWRNLRLLEALPKISDKFIDSITSSFIQVLGVIPECLISDIDFSEDISEKKKKEQDERRLMIIDVFVWKKIVLMTGKNPFNNEKISIDDIDRVQMYYQEKIELLKKEKQNIIKTVSYIKSVYPPQQ